MEEYLITSSVVGKNKIQKLVFFWMMHGLYVIGMWTAKITDAGVKKFPIQFVKLHLYDNKVQLVHTKSQSLCFWINRFQPLC
jgi:thymidylate synthase